MTARRLRCVLPAALVALLAVVPAARGQAVDETCTIALAKFDPATLNLAYPDDSARYYVGAYTLVPGTHIRIAGRFPHARYMSFNAYDPEQRPIDGLSDIRVTPDKGSANPFLAGADRTGTDHRSYTVFLDQGAKPAQPAPNTLYTGTGQDGSPNLTGTFIYRIYIPDDGRDDTGGVGLPTVQVEPAGATAGPTAASPCATTEKPTVAGFNEALAAASPPTDPPSTGGANPPVWRKFVNLVSAAAVTSTGTTSPGGADLDTLGGSGGFLSNKDNAYVSAPTSRGLGKVLVTRFRAPSFPDTRPGTPRMPSGQLRYWSVCQNDPPTQRFVACVNNDRAVLGADGFATVVTSTEAARPATATKACGVNWIPWGADPRGLLIYRNMLPAAGFTQSVQAATVDHEAATMGEYLPRSTYYADGDAYAKAVGCTPPAPTTGSSTPGVPRTCASRRSVVITLPRGQRSRRTVRVRISSRPARTLRVARGGRVRVDLSTLPRGTYAVVLTAGGKTLTRRTYRTCRTR